MLSILQDLKTQYPAAQISELQKISAAVDLYAASLEPKVIKSGEIEGVHAAIILPRISNYKSDTQLLSFVFMRKPQGKIEHFECGVSNGATLTDEIKLGILRDLAADRKPNDKMYNISSDITTNRDDGVDSLHNSFDERRLGGMLTHRLWSIKEAPPPKTRFAKIKSFF